MAKDEERKYMTKKEKKKIRRKEKEKAYATTVTEDIAGLAGRTKRQIDADNRKEKGKESQGKSRQLRKEMAGKYKAKEKEKERKERGLSSSSSSSTPQQSEKMAEFERKRKEREIEREAQERKRQEIEERELLSLLCRNCHQRIPIDLIDSHSEKCTNALEKKAENAELTKEEKELADLIRKQKKMEYNRKAGPKIDDLRDELMIDEKKMKIKKNDSAGINPKIELDFESDELLDSADGSGKDEEEEEKEEEEEESEEEEKEEVKIKQFGKKGKAKEKAKEKERKKAMKGEKGEEEKEGIKKFISIFAKSKGNDDSDLKKAAQFAEEHPELVDVAYENREYAAKTGKYAYDNREKVSNFVKENPEAVNTAGNLLSSAAKASAKQY